MLFQFTERRLYTNNHAPIFLPPYRMILAYINMPTTDSAIRDVSCAALINARVLRSPDKALLKQTCYDDKNVCLCCDKVLVKPHTKNNSECTPH